MMTKTKLLGAAAALLFSAGAAAAVPAVSRSDLNVRSGPGTGYGVVGVIQAGETVDVATCTGSWCQVAFDGGSGYASRSYLQIAGGAPSGGVVVQGPAYYDPYDYGYYDEGFSYGPSIGIYAGPRYGYGWRGRHDGWRGRHDGWRRGDRNAGNWRGGDRGNWRGGDRSGPRMGGGIGRGPQPGSVDRGGGGARVSAPAGMSSAPAARGPAPSAPAAAAPGGNVGAGGQVRGAGR